MAPSEALTSVILGPDDVPEGLALSDAAGWNQTSSKTPSRTSSPFDTQLSATPPARHK